MCPRLCNGNIFAADETALDNTSSYIIADKSTRFSDKRQVMIETWLKFNFILICPIVKLLLFPFYMYWLSRSFFNITSSSRIRWNQLPNSLFDFTLSLESLIIKPKFFLHEVFEYKRSILMKHIGINNTEKTSKRCGIEPRNPGISLNISDWYASSLPVTLPTC